MTERDPQQPDDEQDAGDWLASQFDPAGAAPKPVVPSAAPPPAAAPLPPAVPQQPVAPPRFDNPFPGIPPSSNPYAQNPQQPPAAPQPPAPQQPPAAPQQPLPPQPPAPAQPIPGGFSWGLTPGAPPASPAPPAPAPPAPAAPAPAPPAPPAPPAAPVASPPVAPPPAASPPGTWFEPVVQHPDPAPLDPAIAGIPPESQPPAAPMPFETTVLPDVAPDARDAPAFWEPEPTQMMDAVELPEPKPEPAPKQPFTRSVFPEGTELLPQQPSGETDALSGLDSLFGESQFREYSDRPDPSENPFARRAEQEAAPGAAGAGGGKPPRAPGITTVQKVLLWVLGSVLAVMALIGLFLLGIRLPDLLGPSPAVAPIASPSPSASHAVVLGPVKPGTYAWDELLGGECIEPYDSAYQAEYTVVECTEPHAAQLVKTGAIVPVAPVTGVFDPDAYPGDEALLAQTIQLCQAPGIFSPAASGVTDAQLTTAYPTEDQWADGGRAYFCFVTRASGEPLTVDLALPQVAPTPPPAETAEP